MGRTSGVCVGGDEGSGKREECGAIWEGRGMRLHGEERRGAVWKGRDVGLSGKGGAWGYLIRERHEMFGEGWG